MLLSASPVGLETQVNTETAGNQSSNSQGGSVAMDADGDYVVTWASNGQDGSGYGIYAQRYNAAGVPQGGEFQVNTTTTNQQFDSTVAVDAAGDFVITWTSYDQDGGSGGIYAQRYNAARVAQGGEFRVNTATATNQAKSSVAMDAEGDFVVTWTSYAQDGNSQGVFAQRFNSAGVAQGGEFLVNTFINSNQQNSTVAMDADGDFVIVWESNLQEGSGYGIYAQRYDAAGVAQGGEFLVNTSTFQHQRSPTVAMDADGDFVVTWQSGDQDGSGDGVYAQRFSAAGVKQDGEFLVNTTTAGSQFWPTVAMDADGDFVVSWSSSDGSSYGVYAQQYTAGGATVGGEVLINTTTANSQWFSSVAMDATGDFVVVWSSYLQDGSINGVFSQRFDESTDIAGPIVAQVLDSNRLINAGDVLVTEVTGLTVVFSEDLNVTGGSGGANSVTNPANWSLTRNGVDVSANISGITFGFNAVTNRYEADISFTTPLADGAFALIAKQSIQDLAGNALDGDLSGTPGEDFARNFSIATLLPAGPETKVSLFDNQHQATNPTGQAGAVAMDASGNYVVVWEGDGAYDDSGYGIYAQRYNAAGEAQGGNFLVNTYTSGHQRFATVAMDATGDFVVTWSDYGSQDGSLSGVYAQRFDSTGVAQGSEFRVNTTTDGNQAYSTVAMEDNGDFVVTWTTYNQDAPGTFGVFARRYDAAGTALSGEFQVNTTAAGIQGYPVIAMDADGDFVIAWYSDQSGSGYDIYAQRYNAAGTAQGTEFQVNTFTVGNQQLPTVAMNDAGDFAVTWSSEGQDGSGWGVFAQRYNAAGMIQGTEFQVNTTVESNQMQSAIAMDAAGDFIVTWQGWYADGWSNGIVAQGYSAAGVAQGGEIHVNTFTDFEQQWSSVAASPSGAFAVVWSSRTQDGSDFGVYSQLVRADVSPSLTGIEASALAYPVGNPAVAVTSTLVLSDPDSANMVNAVVQIATGNQVGDLLSFTDTPNITGAWDPDSWTLTLTGSDTVANYEAALRSITFFSSSVDASDRSVNFQVNDGLAYSNVQTRTIDFTTAPDLSGIEATALPYAPAAAATVITSTLTLTDSDPMASATIQITGNYQNGSDVLAFVDTPNISGVFNAATGTLTLTGADTVANYQAALRSVTYQSTSQDPSARTVSFQVDDGAELSNIATRDIGGVTQLVGTTLNVYGTPDVDVITVDEAATLDVVVNGVTFSTRRPRLR